MITEYVVRVGLIVLIYNVIRQWWYRFIPWRRDPQRRFTMDQYRLIMNLAGWRCEHHDMFGRRCEARKQLEADHVRPYARGGTTTIPNSQALCHWHNTRKRAWVPSAWAKWRLGRRRREYFRPGTDTRVRRR